MPLKHDFLQKWAPGAVECCKVNYFSKDDQKRVNVHLCQGSSFKTILYSSFTHQCVRIRSDPWGSAKIKAVLHTCSSTCCLLQCVGDSGANCPAGQDGSVPSRDLWHHRRLFPGWRPSWQHLYFWHQQKQVTDWAVQTRKYSHKCLFSSLFLIHLQANISVFIINVQVNLKLKLSL